jgi:hypothetical protein
MYIHQSTFQDNVGLRKSKKGILKRAWVDLLWTDYNAKKCNKKILCHYPLHQIIQWYSLAIIGDIFGNIGEKRCVLRINEQKS